MAVAEDDSAVMSDSRHPAAFVANETSMRWLPSTADRCGNRRVGVAWLLERYLGAGSKCCRAKADVQRAEAVLGVAFHNHHDTHNRGPKNWQELATFAPAGLQQTLEGKGYQFIWGVSLSEMMEGTSNTAIAYPSDAATSGGLILAGRWQRSIR